MVSYVPGRQRRFPRPSIVFTGLLLIGEVTVAAPGTGAPAPFLSFGAQPSELAAGDKARLSWASLNADSCTASGDWSGEQPANGHLDTDALSQPMTYTLSCTGAGGTIERRVFVNVLNATPAVAAEGGAGEAAVERSELAVERSEPEVEGGSPTVSVTAPQIPAAPASAPVVPEQPAVPDTPVSTTGALTLTASPSAVAYGGETTLTWSAADASKCIASGAWAGTKSPSGREVLRGLNGESRFSLTCMGPRGAASREVVVNVGAAAPVTVDLTTTAGEIQPNGTTTLVWSASGAHACSASGAWLGPRGTRGTESTSALTASGTFAITCTGPGGSASDSVAVTVSANETAAAMSYTASP